MLKRLKELDDKAEECKQEAKRIREDNEITDILDKDLAEWKSKLEDTRTTPPQECTWRLFFFLKEQHSDPTYVNYSGIVFEKHLTLQAKRPWLFKDYIAEFSAENPDFHRLCQPP